MIEATRRTVPLRKEPGVLARIVGAETQLRARDALQGYLFALPWLLGLVIFVAGPILASMYYGFTEYSILGTPSWIGLGNYKTAFFDDTLFWPSLGRTLYYSGVMVPIALLGSLFLATLLNQHLLGTNVFRTIFFLPHLTPTVAMAVLWLWLLHPQLGPVNAMLGSLGLPKPLWLTSKATVIPSLILISTWGSVGGNNMLIFLAALQGVPVELYEAAQIDGANALSKFRHITLPMISPSILFNLVLGVIGALKVFGMAYVATKGGPNYGSWFFALHIYNQAFLYFRLGYGSALAWVFATIVIIFTLVQLKLSGRWVYYAGV
jgi:multiple sugar transport system permease protein